MNYIFKFKFYKSWSIQRLWPGRRNQNIGIIADYDVDGSTSAAILIKFFEFYQKKLYLKIPDRLNEGYGPNTRIMNYFLKEKII